MSNETTAQRLWDVEHSYYCNEGNYFTNNQDCSSHYRRWQDFLDEQGSDDMDLNLVFRFDWEAPHEEGDSEKPIRWQGDENYRDSTLKIFFLNQRKGIYRWATVEVCRADEPSVREWLTTRWNHMKNLWSPLG